MKICVIYPGACSTSAKALAAALGADAINPYDTGRTSFSRYDLVFNYGCGNKFQAKHMINSAIAVERCVDKIQTFNILKRKGLSHPDFKTSRNEVPKYWETIVCRKDACAAMNKGMEYAYKGDVLPHAELYTEYFEHKWEYRIVLFMGKVVGRYHKVATAERWDLILMQKAGFEAIDYECQQAAQAIGVDYVGFDVLENEDGEFVILEANSGPILTEEVKKAIVKRLKGI
jgi:glutathione synthase/RimK-type ligase-like ATP-grasp enzyme